jgi:hypothetical protein
MWNKKILFFLACCWMFTSSIAQKQVFDLVTYTSPKSWIKDHPENMVTYTITNNKTGGWCRISIIKSTTSIGSIEADFENEWQGLIVKNYQPTDTPQVEKVQETNGWKIKSGTVKFIFNNAGAAATLTTASGYNRCISIVSTTNSMDYSKDMEALLLSVKLIKPVALPKRSDHKNNNSSITGTWCISRSELTNTRVANGVVSTIFQQYTFKADGSYACNIKTFDPLMNSILLGRETGSFQINGSSLTVTPKKSVLEEWSKKNGSGDEWGKLIKTQIIAPEKVIYQFSKIYIPENNEWQLILKAYNQTRRDGPYNNYDRNGWIYILSSPARPVIKLPNE